MIKIPMAEIQFTFTRAPGPGGQNVNKVATSVELRWDVKHSAFLSEEVRTRFISLVGKKMTLAGEVIIKASRYRTQERNKEDALTRLRALLLRATTPPKKRKKTRPSFASVQRRLTTKKLHSKTKALRRSKTDMQ